MKKRNIILIGNDGLICGVWYGRGVRSIIITNFELLKVAIDMGVETPEYIPSIPTFRNEIKENYKTHLKHSKRHLERLKKIRHWQ